MEFEITLRNHKDVPITVQVNEPIGGTGRCSPPPTNSPRPAAFAAQFQVPVDKNGTSVLKYRVRVTY